MLLKLCDINTTVFVHLEGRVGSNNSEYLWSALTEYCNLVRAAI